MDLREGDQLVEVRLGVELATLSFRGMSYAYLWVERVVVVRLLHVDSESPDDGVDDPGEADGVHGEVDPLALVEVLGHVPGEEGVDGGDDAE